MIVKRAALEGKTCLVLSPTDEMSAHKFDLLMKTIDMKKLDITFSVDDHSRTVFFEGQGYIQCRSLESIRAEQKVALRDRNEKILDDLCAEAEQLGYGDSPCHLVCNEATAMLVADTPGFVGTEGWEWALHFSADDIGAFVQPPFALWLIIDQTIDDLRVEFKVGMETVLFAKLESE